MASLMGENPKKVVAKTLFSHFPIRFAIEGLIRLGILPYF